MKLVFAGTPEFAAVSLEALLAARHEVTLVLTQPDRPSGRGLKAQPPAVKRLALARGLALLQPASPKDPAAVDAIAATRPAAMVVAAYGRILPPSLLTLPARGCINVHASLLPRWRGAAPIQRALLAGDATTGITIMQMDEGLDTGPILLQEAIPILPDDTAGTLHDKLAALGAKLLIEALATHPVPRAQDAMAATQAPRIAKAEAEINWRKPAAEIERQVRAFDPVPGAQTRMGGVPLKVWRGRIERGASAAPGTVCAAGPDGIVVACGVDALRITELQRAGGKRLACGAFLSGFKLAPGACLGPDHG
ncbi:MAG: methionyl-tRNA formyltransferase [Betaproteobacteria bacterium RIFCSPLOWO2_02_FULL_67_26]|nr:MAG: methionyl-tRNA formyltransferase [Betaproteobacteria bacterium RIFCSPLOWO2_02_FULL_67_26]